MTLHDWLSDCSFFCAIALRGCHCIPWNQKGTKNIDSNCPMVKCTNRRWSQRVSYHTYMILRSNCNTHMYVYIYIYTSGQHVHPHLWFTKHNVLEFPVWRFGCATKKKLETSPIITFFLIFASIKMYPQAETTLIDRDQNLEALRRPDPHSRRRN